MDEEAALLLSSLAFLGYFVRLIIIISDSIFRLCNLPA